MKTKYNTIIRIILCFAILIGLNFTVGCGGGGGGSSSSDGGTAPSAATSVSQGEIEGFGSVFVNGVEWETDNTEFEIEGSPGFSESDLRIGMVVKVEGDLEAGGTTGTATTISFEDNVEGPISSISTSSTGSVKTLLVLGQTVIVENGVTFFDDTPPYSFAALAVGDVIEVSGPTNFDGSVQATFIEKKADDLAAFLAGGDELEVKGTVAALTGTTFLINALTIDYSTATVRDGTLANGVSVEVKGTTLVGNTLTATDVEIKPAGLGVDDIDDAEVEGFVTNLNTSTETFEINGQVVSYFAAMFIGGPEADLLNGTKVEAEGPIVGGVLQAEKVKFKESIEFEANAATVNAGDGELTLENLTGITVMVDDALTEIEPAGRDLNDIVIGNELKVRAREGSGGSIVAIELEIMNQASDRSIIQGPVDSFDATAETVTILGVVVDTSTINNDDFQDINDTVIGRTAFFNQLAVDDLVKARFRAGAWDEIQFEDED